MIKYLIEFLHDYIKSFLNFLISFYFHNKIEDYINDNLQNMKYKVKEQIDFFTKWRDEMYVNMRSMGTKFQEYKPLKFMPRESYEIFSILEIYGVIQVNNKQKKQLLYQIRHIVECNGSDEVLERVDYDLESLYRRKVWNKFNF